MTIELTEAELAAVRFAVSSLGWIPNKHYRATMSASRRLDAASQVEEKVPRLRDGGRARRLLPVGDVKGARAKRAGVSPAGRKAMPVVQASARSRGVVP